MGLSLSRHLAIDSFCAVAITTTDICHQVTFQWTRADGIGDGGGPL